MKKLLIGIALCLFGMSAWADIQCPMTVYCVGAYTDSCIIPAGWNGPNVKKSSLLTDPIIRYSALTFVKAISNPYHPAPCIYEGLEPPYKIGLNNPNAIIPDLDSPSNRWKAIGTFGNSYKCISPTHPEQCLFKAAP